MAFVPIRTCVGCREQADAAALLRVVAQGGSAVVDERCRLPGRGAWLHPRRDCLDLALRRRAVPRALRCDVDARSLAEDPRFA